MRIISVTGGKGGIGKTTLSVNLAVAFAKLRKKVLLLDADLGLANVDVMLGLHPQKTLHDVLLGNCELKDVCLSGPYGLKIIPGASGVQQMAELSSPEYVGIIRAFSSYVEEIDVMIVDMASGISSQVIDFTNASQDILIVICNDPSSLMDSYAVIKILHQKYARKRFGIIVNKTKSQYEGLEVFSRFQTAIEQFINVSLHYLGDIPSDDAVLLAAKDSVSFVDKYPQARASFAVNSICHSIFNWRDEPISSGGIQFFFERLVQCQ